MEKSRVGHRASNYEFTFLTKGEYLDFPQLLYPRPGEMKEIRFMGTNRISEVEISRIISDVNSFIQGN